MPCDRKIGPYDCCSVVQGDCLELMKAIPSEIFRCECGDDVSGEGGVFHIAAGHKMQDGPAIDAVITDPPYDERTHRGADTGAGDFGISFGHLANVDPDPFLKMARKWVVCFCSLEMLGAYANACNGSWIRAGVWDRIQNAPQLSGDRPAQAVEGIAIMHRSGRKEWNGGGCAGIWRHSVERGQKEHPTQKPLALMEELLIDFTNRGETVLDPYCGSGTTLVAAKKLGRHFLGFEISEEYCKIARDRIARIEAQPTLFEPKLEQMNFLDTAKDLK